MTKQFVLIKHEVHYGKKGEGLAQYRSASRPAVQEIKARYMSGKVLTQSGDVWEVEPATGKHKGQAYQFQTVGMVE